MGLPWSVFMYICVDFDGTVVDHDYPEIGAPAPEAIKWLRRVQLYGAKIILFTMRCDSKANGPLLQEAVNYLKDNGIQLYGVNRNPDQGRVDCKSQGLWPCLYR